MASRPLVNGFGAQKKNQSWRQRTGCISVIVEALKKNKRRREKNLGQNLERMFIW